MKESLNNFLTYCCAGLIGFSVVAPQPPQIKRAIATEQIQPNTAPGQIIQPTPEQNLTQGKPQRTLRLSITVDRPEFLKVKQGDEINVGQIISDNTIERDRLLRQRSSIDLLFKNLKSQPIPKPSPPAPVPALTPIPKANYAEEEAAIASAQMKLSQAQTLLLARTPLLKADNPERRAEAEKAEAVLHLANQKVEEQQQLLQSMKDMQLQPEIIRHEETKLEQLEGETSQAKSAHLEAQARLNASGIDAQQQLQQLELSVKMLGSELELAKSRHQAARSRRQLVEYNAKVNSYERFHKEQQLKQEYNQQQQTYATAVRDRDYQLAQLKLSLSAIDDKLSQIPVVKSPQNGYIRRIKPWIGINGKYTTTVIIRSTPSRSYSGDSQNQTNTYSANRLR